MDKAVRIDEPHYRDLTKWAEKAGGLELKEALQRMIDAFAAAPETATQAKGAAAALDKMTELTGVELLLKQAKLAKLREETRYLHTRNVRIEKGLPVGVKTELALEQDTAKPERLWCLNCRVTADTPEEIQAHKSFGHILENAETVGIH
jgi:hypothetical protein